MQLDDEGKGGWVWFWQHFKMHYTCASFLPDDRRFVSLNVMKLCCCFTVFVVDL